VIKLVGAAYLLFIGWKALRSKDTDVHTERTTEANILSPAKAMRVGFLCNALNPKVTIFFLALFTQVIAPETPLIVQAGYGLWMSFATFVWFAFLGAVLTADAIRNRIQGIRIWAERVMGAVLIALSVRVAFSVRE
jgi:threonine/homoserine/homoserine lactone efflux protein